MHSIIQCNRDCTQRILWPSLIGVLFACCLTIHRVQADREFTYGSAINGPVGGSAPASLFSSGLLANRVKNADLLRNYLQELDKYVAIVSRPRFGRASGLPPTPLSSVAALPSPSITSSSLSPSEESPATSAALIDLLSSTNAKQASTSGALKTSFMWPELTVESVSAAADRSFERQQFEKGFVRGVFAALNHIKSQMPSKPSQ